MQYFGVKCDEMTLYWCATVMHESESITHVFMYMCTPQMITLIYTHKLTWKQ